MRFQMEDGSVVDTALALNEWVEDVIWDGHNNISINTKSQWDSQTLYCSRKGRYYLVTRGAGGGHDSCRFVEPVTAAAWLLANNYNELPPDLEQHRSTIEE